MTDPHSMSSSGVKYTKNPYFQTSNPSLPGRVIQDQMNFYRQMMGQGRNGILDNWLDDISSDIGMASRASDAAWDSMRSASESGKTALMLKLADAAAEAALTSKTSLMPSPSIPTHPEVPMMWRMGSRVLPGTPYLPPTFQDSPGKRP